MKDQVVPEEETCIVAEAPRTEVAMVQEFLSLQEQRCQSYNLLDRCMREFRANKRMCEFADTMREITDTFQTVSLAIIQLAKDLEEAGFQQSARLIEALQDMEQLKLKLTSDAHIKQQAVTSQNKAEDQEQLLAVRKQQGELIININEMLEEIRYQASPE